MIRPRAAAVTGAVLAALLASGCAAGEPPEPAPGPSGLDLSLVEGGPDSGNGLWHLSGPAALDEVSRAAREARWFAMTGTVGETIPVSGGTALPGRNLSFRVAGRPGEYSAAFGAGAQQVELVVVGGSAYVRGNAAYAARIGVPEVETGFVCLAADDALVTEWAALTAPAAVLDDVLAASDLSVTEPDAPGAATTEIVIGGGGAPIGTVTVAAIGPPLPGQLIAVDPTGSIDIAFAAWGEEQPVEAPTDPVLPCSR